MNYPQKFILSAKFKPSGDQPEAIEQLKSGLMNGLAAQTLLGVTGSGKTFTMANVIADLNRPALILAPNKTLAAQLYSEMKSFFPNNAVEYFVSYYDYYQPEAYVPASDTFIEKDASINAQIEQMRLSATKSFLERRDTIVVASVSAIYGLGDPSIYAQMKFTITVGDDINQREILSHFATFQYTRNNNSLHRSTFRVNGDVIDIFPAESAMYAVRIELFDTEIERITIFDPLTGKTIEHVDTYTFYPRTHYVSPKHVIEQAIELIKAELATNSEILLRQNKLVEEQRLRQRVQFDLEMMQEIGYCSGIENYSRFLYGQEAGDPPPTLFDYLPDDSILIIDESHVTIPQINGMYNGVYSRKKTLVEYGFRLPSALDNRPLTFHEFENLMPQTIYVSATPGEYEILQSGNEVIQQVIRPTGLLDPRIEVRPATNQVDDVIAEIRKRIEFHERTLVTTLTKKMAEDLTKYLLELNIKTKYIHSDTDTVERVEIIKELRLGKIDVLVGINLLREGLDIPEASLVAILDADKEGFLRSTRSLIQTIGRVARNINGTAILYGDQTTRSMQEAIDQTNTRRERQNAYNIEHNITPQTLHKAVDTESFAPDDASQNKKVKQDNNIEYASIADLTKEINRIEKLMQAAAAQLDFENAAKYRDKIILLQEQFMQI